MKKTRVGVGVFLIGGGMVARGCDGFTNTSSTSGLAMAGVFVVIVGVTWFFMGCHEEY